MLPRRGGVSFLRRKSSVLPSVVPSERFPPLVCCGFPFRLSVDGSSNDSNPLQRHGHPLRWRRPLYDEEHLWFPNCGHTSQISFSRPSSSFRFNWFTSGWVTHFYDFIIPGPCAAKRFRNFCWLLAVILRFKRRLDNFRFHTFSLRHCTKIARDKQDMKDWSTFGLEVK